VAQVKASESESEPEKGRQIIDTEPISIVTTTKIHPCEPDEPEEGECLFHSQMWVRGTPLHFISDSGIQKNLISTEVIKWLYFPTKLHPQLYTIGWLCQWSNLHVSQQCHLPYGIKPFKYEVLCDVTPFEVFDVILGQPYLWKCHVVYEPRPCSVIITLDRKLYKILEVDPPNGISLISTKKCRKVNSQTEKFFFFVIHTQYEKKVATTSMASVEGLTMYYKKVDKVVEENKDIFSLPRVPLHCHVKHSIDMNLGTPLPNGSVYRFSQLENEEIKHQI
jgi:hypothetical protein